MRASNIVTCTRPLSLQIALLTLIIASVSLPPSNGLAQGPENTLVVVNEESSDSLAVANHYVQLRDIPASNVIFLKGVPTKESWSSKAFKQKVLTPVLDTMNQRGITNQIDCVAYSAGFPTRINFQPELKTYLKQTGKKYAITQHAPWASITSLTYFHRNAYSPSPTFLELDANHFANPRRMKVLANPFTEKDSQRYSSALIQVTNRQYDEATKSLRELATKHPQQTAVVYSLARCLALSGQKDQAQATLQRLKSLGFAYRSILASDKALTRLKPDPAFQTIVSDMEDLADGLTATRNFSSQSFWSQNGWPNGTPGQGERYLMSSVLAVTGTNQSTLNASMNRLKSSADADGTRPQGNVYFADHKDPRSRTRKKQFASATAELKSLGRSASIGSDIYPKNDSRVIGVTMGSAAPKWPASKSTFLPGAICDNFTSYGASWEQTGQTQISEFLDAGAAGASGTVYEPYTIAAKIPSARWHAHYARGTTLAESFFQSVTGPFQLLLVGDPLCCPFGKFPEFKITGIKKGQTVTEAFTLKFEPQAGSPPIKQFDLYYDDVFLNTVTNTNEIKVAIDATPDGYHEFRIVAVADAAIANKRSQKIGFTVARKGLSIKLTIENPKCRLGENLRGQVTSSAGEQVQILQNQRVVASVVSGETFEIPTAKLGLGNTTLQAITTFSKNQINKSEPVSVTLMSQTGEFAASTKTPAMIADGQRPEAQNPDLQPPSFFTSDDQRQIFQSSPISISLRPVASSQADDRRDPPSKAELKKAVAKIRELLKDQYKNSSPDGRAELLKLLQKTADESADKPVNQYALLSECVYAASVFNAVDAGWAACDQLDSNYANKELPHIGFIKQIKTKLDSKSAGTLYAKAINLSEQLIDDDRYSDAGDLAKSLGSALKKSMPQTKLDIDTLYDRAKLLARKYKLIQDDLEVLADEPTNQPANGKVGEFYCLEKNDFDQGLPYLAKGPESELQKLAQDELSRKKATPEQRLQIADRWWELSQDKKLSGYQAIALEHYQQIVDKLTGLPKIAVEKRIEEANSKDPKSTNTLFQLASHAWRVEWEDGKIWKEVRLKKDYFFLQSDSGSTYQWGFRTTARGIETWNTPKTAYFKIEISHDRLICVRIDSKTNKHLDGVGYRVQERKTK